MESTHWFDDLIEEGTGDYTYDLLAVAPPYLDDAFTYMLIPSPHAHAPLSSQGRLHTCGVICGLVSVLRVGVGVPCLGGGLPSLLTLQFRFGALSDVPSWLGVDFWF